MCDSNDNLLIKDCDGEMVYRFNKYLIDRGFPERVLIDCEDSKPVFDGQVVYFEEYDYSMVKNDISVINDNNEFDSKSLNNTETIAKKCCEDVTSKFREEGVDFQCKSVYPWKGQQINVII